MTAMVIAAIEDGRNFEAVLDELSATLQGAAYLMGGGYCGDDILQAGHMKIWTLLPRVDLAAGDDKICHFLTRAALNAMRDEWRAKRNRRQKEIMGNVPEDVPDKPEQAWPDLPGSVAEYVDGVGAAGSVRGARALVQRQHGGSAVREKKRFARMAKDFRFHCRLKRLEGA